MFTKAVLQDIEELSILGKTTKTCAYYGTRKAILDADIICVPYNLLLQKSSRDAIGLQLEESIVILDEAHNVMDAINSMHSVILNRTHVFKTHIACGMPRSSVSLLRKV